MKNLRIWHGKLPHWRADHSQYYITFRYSRGLSSSECRILYVRMCQLTKLGTCSFLYVGTKSCHMAVEFPEATLISKDFTPKLEQLKAKAGREIIKKSGERFPPFYAESYDHIVRDSDDFRALFEEMVQIAQQDHPNTGPHEVPFLWVEAQPEPPKAKRTKPDRTKPDRPKSDRLKPEHPHSDSPKSEHAKTAK